VTSSSFENHPQISLTNAPSSPYSILTSTSLGLEDGAPDGGIGKGDFVGGGAYYRAVCAAEGSEVLGDAARTREGGMGIGLRPTGVSREFEEGTEVDAVNVLEEGVL